MVGETISYELCILNSGHCAGLGRRWWVARAASPDVTDAGDGVPPDGWSWAGDLEAGELLAAERRREGVFHVVAGDGHIAGRGFRQSTFLLEFRTFPPGVGAVDAGVVGGLGPGDAEHAAGVRHAGQRGEAGGVAVRPDEEVFDAVGHAVVVVVLGERAGGAVDGLPGGEAGGGDGEQQPFRGARGIHRNRAADAVVIDGGGSAGDGRRWRWRAHTRPRRGWTRR